MSGWASRHADHGTSDAQLRFVDSQGDYPGMGYGTGMAHKRLVFAEFDINADGVITEEEFYTVRNNRIKTRMDRGYRMRNLPNAPTFADLDTDGDGVISAEEFAAHQGAAPRGRTP